MTRLHRALLVAALIAPLSAAAAPAPSAPAATARAFVEGLYRAYGRGEPDYLGRRAGEVFAAPLLALIRRDQAQTHPGDAPDLDWDPICACQDAGGLRVERLEVAAAGAGAARASVRLRFADGAETVRLDLVMGPHGWRIADIDGRDAPSLVALLRASVQGSGPAGPSR